MLKFLNKFIFFSKIVLNIKNIGKKIKYGRVYNAKLEKRAIKNISIFFFSLVLLKIMYL